MTNRREVLKHLGVVPVVLMLAACATVGPLPVEPPRGPIRRWRYNKRQERRQRRQERRENWRESNAEWMVVDGHRVDLRKGP
jgi:hypothetical protein